MLIFVLCIGFLIKNKMNHSKVAIVVAGGKGERMQSDIPKQFLEINGKPILMYTLDAFGRYDASVRLILVLPANQIEYWEKLCKKHAFTLDHRIVAGGSARFFSVKNGLEHVADNSLVAIHDGVRPLVSTETISRCFEMAALNGSAIPVVDMVDSVRQLTINGSASVDRSQFKLVQTPQIFDAGMLKKAYMQEFTTLFTDDASVVEAMGNKIELVEGNRENIKITTAMDLKFAELLLK